MISSDKKLKTPIKIEAKQEPKTPKLSEIKEHRNKSKRNINQDEEEKNVKRALFKVDN